jgi:outer membrane lipoprotein-sorting protein
MTRTATLLSITLLLLAGCADAWAQSMSRQIARDLERMESYQGVTVEDHISDDGPVRRRVTYARPWRVRVETLAPAAHAGELFLYDGAELVMYWPKQQFGIRVRNLPAPTRAELRRHIERLTRDNMAAYAFSLRSQSARVAGQTTYEWRVIPTRASSNRHRHTVWNDRRYPMPLRIAIAGQDGAPWYDMRFESIAFDQPIPDDTFAFTFPKNTVLFEWDAADPGISLADAREQMNFAVKEPSYLPRGHSLGKVIKAAHCLPMITFLMNDGASVLSLTESRDMGLAEPPPGKTVQVGEHTGVLSFLGPFATVTWVADGTLLSLTGNVGYPELLAVAASVR